jgi:TonB family protein
MTANFLTFNQSSVEPKASAWFRFCALLLDGATSIGLGFFTTQLLNSFLHLNDFVLGWSIIALSFVFFLIDELFLPLRNGQTFGKYLVGIRIVPAEDPLDAVTLGMLVKRNLLGYLFSSPLLLGFVSALFQSQGQGWHDRLGGTLVVDEPRRAENNLIPAIISSLLLHMLVAGAVALLALLLPLILRYIKLPFPDLVAKEVPPAPLEYVLIDKPNKLGKPAEQPVRKANVNSNAGGKRDPQKRAETGATGQSAAERPAKVARRIARRSPTPTLRPEPTDSPQPVPQPRPIVKEPEPAPQEPAPVTPDLLPQPKAVSPVVASKPAESTEPAPRKRKTRSSAVGGGSPSSLLGGAVTASSRGSAGNGGFGDNGDFNPDRNGPGQGVDAEQDADFGPYMASLKRRVRRNWIAPESGSSRRTVLNFAVSRSGGVSRLRIARSSGSNSSDQAAMDAVRRAAPFGSLPSAYKGDNVEVTFTFDVNVFGGEVTDF